MLIALGFKPLKAATVSLVGNTAPVAFGSIATPIITLARVTALPVDDLGWMVGRQTPFLALIVPLILVAMVDGRRGLRQTWPAAAGRGVAFAIAQFVLLELHLGRAHRHHRLAGLGRRAGRLPPRLAAVGAAARRADRGAASPRSPALARMTRRSRPTSTARSVEAQAARDKPATSRRTSSSSSSYAPVR